VGELWVRGPSVAPGYFGATPEAESAGTSFGHRLEGEAGTWLRTRDFGGIFEDDLFITGRLADLIILGGRNIYPQDVERAAEAAHPALSRGGSVAFSVEGEDRERLVVAAEVERAAVRGVDPEAVTRAVRGALFTEEGLGLDELVLLRPAALPRTTSGKPRRRACRELYLSRQLARLAPGERSS
jgi:acyl-CoA synthetase (AMP-forming)/AMP-acid ligase II